VRRRWSRDTSIEQLPPELRERAVRMVAEVRPDYPSDWPAIEAERRTLELTEQGQVTDRYTKAIEQLGSDKLGVRIGGIYALQRIASDSAQDQPTVIEVLAAFVRDHSRKRPSGADADPRDEEASFRGFPADLQAAFEVIGRQDLSRDTRQIRLWGVRCAGAYLRDLDFTGASFFEADLRQATLASARLCRVVFSSAHLTRARLMQADLSNATVAFADLTDADLRGAILEGTNLAGTKLTRANLEGADLTGARLEGADLTRTKLINANLTGSCLSRMDIPDADVTGAGFDGADLTDV
jgi:uncharacterized protein YjbI with pentapeptide repeats